MAQGMLAPEALEEIFRFFRLRAGLVTSERDGLRLLYRAEGEQVDDLCLLVQTRLRQRLKAQLQHLAVS